VTPWVVWILTGLGLGAAVVRRRSVASGLVASQTLGVAAGAVWLIPGRSTEFAVAAVILSVKAFVVGPLLWIAVARTRETRPVRDDAPPLLRLGVTLTLMLVFAGLMPTFELDPPAAGRGAAAMVAIGLAMVVLRRAAIFQVLALLVAENGVAVAAVSVSGGLPVVIELGIAFDAVLLVMVAVVFHQRIFTSFGTTDTQVLGELRDER
jgi:hydrogenase-4 component E